jgi:hypothetical protein
MLVLGVTSCDSPEEGVTPPTTTGPSSTTAPSSSTTTSTPDATVTIRYAVERRVDDLLTEGFESTVVTTLGDAKGWVRAGFRFVPAAPGDPDAPYLVVLAEGPEVDTLCFPYETGGAFSCQNGPVVALNADRWRSAHPKWTGDLATYREMLVNHEVGHLIGMHHPDVPCPQAGRPAEVMAQQSTELDGCLPNPWPLAHEIERAARHDLKIAPGYGE